VHFDQCAQGGGRYAGEGDGRQGHARMMPA